MTLVDVTSLFFWLIGGALLVPVVVLFIEVAASYMADAGRRVASLSPPRVAVLVPAHDEALSIEATIASILPELRDRDRLLIVADNCADHTEMFARAAGAEVIARTDPMRRGKGYALDYGMRHLESDPPDIVIVVDADCQPDSGSLARIAAIAAASSRPVQARYVIAPPSGKGRSLYLSIASFAMLVKNLARPIGSHRLGLACQLMGTGMAFPWRSTQEIEFATSEIVEDLVYGLQLAEKGYPPIFCPDAVIRSEFPASEKGQITQRTRWENGHLNTIMRLLPGLFARSKRDKNFLLLMLVLDAAVPPLAFLALMVGAFSLLAIVATVITGATWPGIIALALNALLLVTVLLAWWRFGRKVLSLREMALAPLYILSKVGLYGSVLIGRRIGWKRSEREGP